MPPTAKTVVRLPGNVDATITGPPLGPRRECPVLQQARVPVVSMDGRPLGPTTPPNARVMLRDGVAAPRRNKLGLFYVQMLIPTRTEVPPMALALDPGAKFEGVAVASHIKVEVTGQVNLPAGVPKKNKERARLRRARRFRNCPRRPARFNNRRHGMRYWLAPTQASKVAARLKAVGELCKVYPIQAIYVEDVRHRPSGKGARHFSTAEVGKKLTYEELAKLAPMTLVAAAETAAWRKRFGLEKIQGPKRPVVFEAQAVDAAAILMGLTGCGLGQPPFHVWTALRFARRSLHRQEFQKGGRRPRFGGTTNGTPFRKGDWVEARTKDGRLRGWVCGLPTGRTPLVAVADANGKRVGKWRQSDVRLLARAGGFTWKEGAAFLPPPDLLGLGGGPLPR